MFQKKTKENKKDLNIETNNQHLNSKIVEINSIDSTVKEITMLIHKISSVNQNGLDFLLPYVEKYKNTIINKPVVCKYYPEKDDLGSHEEIRDPNTGEIIELRTIAIGTMTDAWIGKYQINDEVSVDALYAKATIWEYKYPQIMACIQRMYEEEVSTSSVEVEIYEYGENPTRHYRYATDYSYMANCLLSEYVPPADADAGITDITYKEIAQAIKQDLSNQELNEKTGGEEMDKKKIEFNNGKKIVYRIEKSELSYEDVCEDIFKLLNGFDVDEYWDKYDQIKYTIEEIYQTFVVVEDEEAEKLYKVNYRVENDAVILDDQSQWTEVKEAYVPVDDKSAIDAPVDEDEDEKDDEPSSETNNKEEINVDEIKELTQEIANRNVEIESLKGQVSELNSKIEELNGLVVSKTEEVAQRDEQITEFNTQVEELTVYKTNFEKAEKEAKQSELSQKYSKLINKEVFASDRVKQAIEECNVTELNSVVVEESLKAKEIEVNNASEDIIVNASSADAFAPELSVRERLYASSEE